MAEQHVNNDESLKETDLEQVSGGGVMVPDIRSQEQADKLRNQEQADKIGRSGENNTK